MHINNNLLTPINSSPICLSIFSVDTLERYWHQSIEIIYVLSGNLQIQCGSINTYNLKEDDIILINMFDVHTLSSDQCEILSLQVNISQLESDLFHFYKNRFDCNSSIERDKSRFIPLKKLIASIVKSNIDNDTNVELLNKSYTYQLFYILSSYFKVENNSDSQNINKNLDRIKNIINYIDENYAQKISLADLSKAFYLSTPYLSKTFKDFTKLSFSEYLMDIRLSHAINDLANQNYTIEYIAARNGFSNTRSFVTAFKNKYNCIPSRYRQNLELESKSSTAQNNLIDAVNYLNLHHNNSFNRLVNYLDNNYIAAENKSFPIKIHEIAPIDALDKTITLKHNFKNLVCIGKAKHILNVDIQKMLKMIQNEIGFKYIRFHGILDDEMMLYSEDENGNPEFCFTYIDSVIDFLLSIDLKPFFELSFMPRALAGNPSRTMFFISSVISVPKSMEKWRCLIKKLVNHLILRYGKAEVKSWPFFLWNEPDLIHMFGFEDKSDFFNFYRETYKTVKEVCPAISFGSSPVFSDTLAGLNDWMDSFIDFCRLNDCLPDYLTMHFYPMNLSGKNPATLSQECHLQMRKYLLYSECEDLLKENIKIIKRRSKDYNLNNDDLYLIGWNSSISHNELLNDTVYKSAYIAKNILENYDDLESFGYWQLSDFTEEVKMNNELFHGGQGIFTYNNIKKPHYHVFKMLNKLGDKLLKKGNGFFITKEDDDSIQIIVYNYQHYSKLYASGELFDMTFSNRYTPFSNPYTLKMILPLVNLPHNNYLMTETIINRNFGSSFDKWLQLGGIPLENQEDADYLNSVSLPKIRKEIVYPQNKSLSLNIELEPFEVRLIELKSCYN